MALPLALFFFLAGCGVAIARWTQHKTPNLSLVLLMLLAFALALGRGTPANRLAARLNAVPRVSPAYALQQVRDGRAVLVDVRAPSVYQVGHVQGALNMTYRDAKARLNELAPGHIIIVYCA